MERFIITIERELDDQVGFKFAHTKGDLTTRTEYVADILTFGDVRYSGSPTPFEESIMNLIIKQR